ncbi:SRPBCC family protein [Methylobacterium sp. CB376]|uniref:SRPBCC family protein n=1 Tax=Methylobacterium sp. CB376 TaxID=3138063 RepID=UPI0024B0D6A6|nr:SRPBCC family protein [Methylobacterium nodulans]WFT79172.1 SRPBCC family protein [Methylobacterium nodulans]
MRLLHARHAGQRARPRAAAAGGGRAAHPGRPLGQSLPLHRLRRYRAGGGERHRRPPRPRHRTERARAAPARSGRRAGRRGPRSGPAPPATAAAAAPGAAPTLAGTFRPAHRFTQTIDLAHPPEAVFALLGDIAAVAACLPGAVLTGRPAPDAVEGGLQVRIGPIAATFRGRALIERDEAARTGRVRGAGSDAGGRSATEGEIRYRVEPGAEPGTARVALEVGYSLTGPLAQFGRPGLVRDLAGRIAAAFARNLDAQLSGAAPPAPAALNPVRLLLGLIRARLAAWLARA